MALDDATTFGVLPNEIGEVVDSHRPLPILETKSCFTCRTLRTYMENGQSRVIEGELSVYKRKEQGRQR